MSKWIEFQMVKNTMKKTKQSKGEMDSDLGMRRYLRWVGQNWHLNTDLSVEKEWTMEIPGRGKS